MITRLEIIDWTKDGRTVIAMPTDNKKIWYDLQDDGRTLKVFIEEAKSGDKNQLNEGEK